MVIPLDGVQNGELVEPKDTRDDVNDTVRTSYVGLLNSGQNMSILDVDIYNPIHFVRIEYGYIKIKSPDVKYKN